jgi:hypothetical protein
MFAVALERSGTDYLLVSSIDASENFRLDRFHDSTADGVPDQSTRTTLVVSTEPMYVTWMSVVDAVKVLLLDRRCQDVLVAKDTNSDGWVDAINSTPFAASGVLPELLPITHISSFVAANDDLVVWGREVAPNSVESISPLFTVLALQDTDDDDVADGSATENPADRGPRVIDGRPFDGQSELAVSRFSLNSPATIEVWELDENEDDVAQLGSIALGMGVGSGVVSLSPAPSAGDVLGIRYQGNPTSQTTARVLEAYPQVLSVTPGVVDPEVTATVTLTGLNFSSTMAVKLVKHRETFVDVISFTYVSDTVATIVVPAQSDLEAVWVAAFADGQTVEPNEYPTARLTACEPP